MPGMVTPVAKEAPRPAKSLPVSSATTRPAEPDANWITGCFIIDCPTFAAREPVLAALANANPGTSRDAASIAPLPAPYKTFSIPSLGASPPKVSVDLPPESTWPNKRFTG